MIYLSGLQKVSEGKFYPTNYHYQPFDHISGLNKTKEQLEREGVLVESIPEPEIKPNMSSTMYINPETKDIWYEYEIIPPTEEDKRYDNLFQQLKETQLAVNTMLKL